MPTHRDKHGAVVDEDTEVTRRGRTGGSSGDVPHDPRFAESSHAPAGSARDDAGDPGASHYDEPTRLVRRTQRGSAPDDDATILRRPSRHGRRDADAEPEMGDPVTGWLVVTAGPGRGRSLRLGLGRNEIGRAASASVRLDFGDQQVSRTGHAYVSYDNETRLWYIQQGGGRNLVRLDDRPVLAPTLLQARSVIRIGGTRLLFVPLCGKDFDWEDIGIEG